MHDVDTQLLRTFVSLAETRSFSRTAGRVGRSQSAVSGQLAKLEAALGVRLFARDTRNVALTPEGERLLPEARAMVAQADAMLARFRTPDIAGLVRFGSPEDFTSFYLPDILGVFATAHPAVELHVTCQLTLPLIAEFEAGEQDVIVVKQDPARPNPSSRKRSSRRHSRRGCFVGSDRCRRCRTCRVRYLGITYRTTSRTTLAKKVPSALRCWLSTGWPSTSGVSFGTRSKASK